ncbi:MAG TPA: RES family NAD+ phosphorylase [Acidobacteriaceae bacterium]
MILWRISPFADLSGIGGLKYSGRWHSAGRAVVYLAESPAGALLEVCAHTSEESVPPTFNLLKIGGPDIAADEVADLPAGWSELIERTQTIGSEWLDSRRGGLLRVPSVLVPETWNILLNPEHAVARDFKVERRYEYPFDLRLKR